MPTRRLHSLTDLAAGIDGRNPLRSYEPSEGRQPLGDLWTLTLGGNVLRCTIATHPLGWELQLKVWDDQVPTSQLFMTEEQVFTESAQWREAAIGVGWVAIPSVD